MSFGKYSVNVLRLFQTKYEVYINFSNKFQVMDMANKDKTLMSCYFVRIISP